MAQALDTRSLGAKGADVLAQLVVCLPLGLALTVLFGTIYPGSVTRPSDGVLVALAATVLLAWPMARLLSGGEHAIRAFTARDLARAIYVRGPAWTAAGLLWGATWLLLIAGGFALGVLFIRVLRGG